MAKHVFSGQRIGAMVLRYLYLLRGSWPADRRAGLLADRADGELGLVTRFFVTNSSWVTEAAGVLIAAVFLWDPVPIHFQGRES